MDNLISLTVNLTVFSSIERERLLYSKTLTKSPNLASKVMATSQG